MARRTFVVLAAAGWTCVLQRARWRAISGVAAVALAAGLMSMVSFAVRYHPNQVVHFNALVGGPRGAFRDCELDGAVLCTVTAGPLPRELDEDRRRPAAQEADRQGTR